MHQYFRFSKNGCIKFRCTYFDQNHCSVKSSNKVLKYDFTTNLESIEQTNEPIFESRKKNTRCIHLNWITIFLWINHTVRTIVRVSGQYIYSIWMMLSACWRRCSTTLMPHYNCYKCVLMHTYDINNNNGTNQNWIISYSVWNAKRFLIVVSKREMYRKIEIPK